MVTLVWLSILLATNIEKNFTQQKNFMQCALLRHYKVFFCLLQKKA